MKTMSCLAKEPELNEDGFTAIYIADPCGCGARAVLGFRGRDVKEMAAGCTECSFHTKFYPVGEIGKVLNEWDIVRKAAAVFKDL